MVGYNHERDENQNQNW